MTLYWFESSCASTVASGEWLPQLLILFRREFQPNTTALPSNCLLKLLAAGDIQREAVTLSHLPYLLVGELDRARQGCLEVLLKELAEPALP